MAIVAKEIVHPGAVDDGRLGHALVPGGGGRSGAPTGGGYLGRTQLEVAGRTTEGEVVLGHKVGSGKVADDAGGHGDAHVADHREEPGEHRNRCPDQAEGEAAGGVVDGSGHDGGGGGGGGRGGGGGTGWIGHSSPGGDDFLYKANL